LHRKANPEQEIYEGDINNKQHQNDSGCHTIYEGQHANGPPKRRRAGGPNHVTAPADGGKEADKFNDFFVDLAQRLRDK
jgi:hypothetical protein